MRQLRWKNKLEEWQDLADIPEKEWQIIRERDDRHLGEIEQTRTRQRKLDLRKIR